MDWLKHNLPRLELLYGSTLPPDITGRRHRTLSLLAASLVNEPTVPELSALVMIYPALPHFLHPRSPHLATIASAFVALATVGEDVITLLERFLAMIDITDELVGVDLDEQDRRGDSPVDFDPTTSILDSGPIVTSPKLSHLLVRKDMTTISAFTLTISKLLDLARRRCLQKSHPPHPNNSVSKTMSVQNYLIEAVDRRLHNSHHFPLRSTLEQHNFPTPLPHQHRHVQPLSAICCSKCHERNFSPHLEQPSINHSSLSEFIRHVLETSNTLDGYVYADDDMSRRQRLDRIIPRPVHHRLRRRRTQLAITIFLNLDPPLPYAIVNKRFQCIQYVPGSSLSSFRHRYRHHSLNHRLSKILLRRFERAGGHRSAMVARR